VAKLHPLKLGFTRNAIDVHAQRTLSCLVQSLKKILPEIKAILKLK
jgi:hypothetical protein